MDLQKASNVDFQKVGFLGIGWYNSSKPLEMANPDCPMWAQVCLQICNWWSLAIVTEQLEYANSRVLWAPSRNSGRAGLADKLREMLTWNKFIVYQPKNLHLINRWLKIFHQTPRLHTWQYYSARADNFQIDSIINNGIVINTYLM